MTLEESLYQSLEKLDCSKRKFSKTELINALVLCADNGRVYNTLGISAQAWSKFVKKEFPNKPNLKKLRIYLLELIDKKYCPKCKQVFDLSQFDKNIDSDDTKQTNCKSCSLDNNRKNKSYFVFKSAERKALLLKATPLYGQEGIKELYKNCPIGYHVDHIIPLQGENVCGLHVINNLQYLLARDNIIKRNKY